MLLFWRIRYLDRRDKEFKDRDLWLETDSLDPVAQTAVEAIHELKDLGSGRKMLRHRHLFHEKEYSGEEMKDLYERHSGMSSVFIHDYFEDENGQELTHKQMAVILSGDPNSIMFPPGAKGHDIEFTLAPKRAIPIENISLSQDHLKVLAYFTRDLREMLASAFYKDGPGTLSGGGGRGPTLQTAVTDEEIRSFVMIFRRLYMTGSHDPYSFLKTVTLFGEILPGYPIVNWVKGVAGEYEKDLEEAPYHVPCVARGSVTFSRKRLIDVFLYTQYAHQPSKDRQRQFKECLAAVGNKEPVLTWVFLGAIWQCALHMRNAGAVIADFFDQYCRCHNPPLDVLDSISRQVPGFGMLEKKQDREKRIVNEKVEQLARSLWKAAGSPAGGPERFADQARTKLKEALE